MADRIRQNRTPHVSKIAHPRNHRWSASLFTMEHRNVEFSVLQTSSPTGWKWTFQLEGHKPRQGTAWSREEAIGLAKEAIEKAVKTNLQ